MDRTNVEGFLLALRTAQMLGKDSINEVISLVYDATSEGLLTRADFIELINAISEG